MKSLDLCDINDWVCNLEGLTCHHIMIDNQNVDYSALKNKKKWISKDIIRALFDLYNTKSIDISKIKNYIDINNKVILSHIEYFYLLSNRRLSCYTENCKEKIL